MHESQMVERIVDAALEWYYRRTSVRVSVSEVEQATVQLTDAVRPLWEYRS